MEIDSTGRVDGSLTQSIRATVKVNGKEMTAKAIVSQSKILIPIKEVFESIGATVNINDTNKTAVVKNNDFSFKVVVGENLVTLVAEDTLTITLDHEAVVENNEIYVSVRLALTALKAKLGRELVDGILTIDTLPEQGLIVTSPAFNAWGTIPHRFVQNSVGGENNSLPIEWKDAPADAKSFALVIYDAHLITEYWVHWAVINLEPGTTEIEENAASRLADVQQIKPYYGMQPERFSGDHPYQIAVYALDTEKIDVPNQVVFLEDILPILEPHTIASGTLVGFFQS